MWRMPFEHTDTQSSACFCYSFVITKRPNPIFTKIEFVARKYTLTDFEFDRK